MELAETPAQSWRHQGAGPVPSSQVTSNFATRASGSCQKQSSFIHAVFNSKIRRNEWGGVKCKPSSVRASRQHTVSLFRHHQHSRGNPASSCEPASAEKLSRLDAAQEVIAAKALLVVEVVVAVVVVLLMEVVAVTEP